ncbi:MAG: SGNH/GDSL hydrolase family protein [Lachnospiraceae bacterium]|nr:SGNH/GDSL hydrolase family protein [Lachnospiraceae bacterium]
MKKGLSGILTGTISLLLVLLLQLGNIQPVVYTDKDDKDPIIVVSLGDSYSSGEGIEPFYGQNKDPIYKTSNPDWLAHRSEKSWPGLIEIPIDDKKTSGPMNQYRVFRDGRGNYPAQSNDFQWYFVAASGATTKDFYDVQYKPYDRWFDGRHWEGEYPLPAQLKIFDKIEGTVDYVTFTIGGNDVGFFEVVRDVAFGFAILGSTKVEKRIEDTWKAFDYGTEDDPEPIKVKIKNAYKAVAEKAPDAEILVVGYPKLFSTEWYNYVSPLLADILEAQMVNEAVSQFNNRLEALVADCRKEGLNIHFVDVEEEFDGHEVGVIPEKDRWLNLFTVPYQSEDLEELPYSCYSMHPNETGAIHYAKCVNDKIAEIEKKKREEKKAQESVKESSEGGNSSSNVSGKPISLQKWTGTWINCENDSDKFTVNSDDTVTINGIRFSVEQYKTENNGEYCYVKAKNGSGLWYDASFGTASLFDETADEIFINAVNGGGNAKKIKCGAYYKEGTRNLYRDFFGTWTAQNEPAVIDGITINAFSIGRDGTFQTGQIKKEIQFEHAYGIVMDFGGTFYTMMPGFRVIGTQIHGQFEPMLYHDHLTIRVNDKPYLYRKTN